MEYRRDRAKLIVEMARAEFEARREWAVTESAKGRAVSIDPFESFIFRHAALVALLEGGNVTAERIDQFYRSQREVVDALNRGRTK
jgi:hypothetical protein